MFTCTRVNADGAHSEWKIETQDGTRAEFPTDSKLKTLLKKYAPQATVVVKERGQDSITLSAPAGEMPRDQSGQEFLKALWKATTFK
jgi:hypothetical protein